MVAHGRLLKREFPEASVVFIGPCIAKKAEAEEDEVQKDVDVVLTFSELREWFKEEHLELSTLSEESFSPGRIRFARAFPVEGGLIKSTSLEVEFLSREVITITGIERCKEFLKSFTPERARFRIIEMMSCEGGCIDGPVLSSILPPYERRERVLEYTEKSLREYEEHYVFLDPPSFRRNFVPSPVPKPEVPEEDIRRILAFTGKFTPQDELNCGACGYNTCREKAEAVYQGMAEAEMCIPFMRTKAESFSSFLLTVTPNGIVLVDEDLRVVEMNPALRRMLGLVGKLVVGRRIDELLDPSPFVEVLRTKQAVTREVVYPQYHNLCVRLSVFFLEKSHLLMGIFVDLTREREQEAMMEAIREKTIEKAQQVIANQMRVAQEIASLLGETTAETKVLLNKLMRILRGELVEE
ncbi:MAG: PAS domain-containing protein [Candidatus Caldatribacterium sp.]|nr:PAS domain-containing protein [Candidatus Caldatribacterium sp.]